jgi:hypothetical protein
LFMLGIVRYFCAHGPSATFAYGLLQEVLGAHGTIFFLSKSLASDSMRSQRPFGL